MSLYELDVAWAQSPDERRSLRWELQGCDGIVGVFATARTDVIAVLFAGPPERFSAWVRELATDVFA